MVEIMWDTSVLASVSIKYYSTFVCFVRHIGNYLKVITLEMALHTPVNSFYLFREQGNFAAFLRHAA
jgi:hypothetical protein